MMVPSRSRQRMKREKRIVNCGKPGNQSQKKKTMPEIDFWLLAWWLQVYKLHAGWFLVVTFTRNTHGLGLTLSLRIERDMDPHVSRLGLFRPNIRSPPNKFEFGLHPTPSPPNKFPSHHRHNKHLKVSESDIHLGSQTAREPSSKEVKKRRGVISSCQ
jgi:hypothetical protein